MTFIPVASVVLGDETPILGDPDDVTHIGAFARDVADDAEHFGRFAASAQQSLLGQQGLGVARLAARLGDGLQPGASALYASALNGQQALNRYALAIDQLHQEARNLLAQVNAELEVIRGAAGSIDAIAEEIGVRAAYVWDEGPPGVLPEPGPPVFGSALDPIEASNRTSLLRFVHEQPWRAAALRWRDAIDEVSHDRRRWGDLIERRKQAEATLREALAATEIGQLISLGPATGQSSAQAITTAIVGEAWGVTSAGNVHARSHPLLARVIGSRSGAGLWEDPPDPVRVAAAWNALSEDERQTLIDEVPWVIGNLPGLPFAARDAANRNQLEYFIVHQEGLGPNHRAAVDEIMKVLAAEKLQIAKYGLAKPPLQIVAFGVASEVPRAAIGYGDLDGAKNLNWAVPGMFNDVHEGLSGWDNASRILYQAQVGHLERLGRTGEGNALIAYFEYDTPNLLTVLSEAPARAAAARFAAELDGAFATRQENESLSNHGVLAHSYGTPVAANALVLTKFSVQSFTMMGSAGLDGGWVSSIADLNVDRDAAGLPRVYSTMSSADGTAPFGSRLSGRLQPNPQAANSPSEAIDGAQLFSSDGTKDLAPVTGHGIVREDGGGYLDRRTQSLDSVARLSLGESEEVTGGLQVGKKDDPTAASRVMELSLGGP